MTRVLATADLHIGSGSDYADDRLADQDGVLDQILTVARERQVDLIVIAGDVFHRPRPTPSELHVFARFVRRLAEAHIPAVAVLGNAGHDQDGFGRPAALELFDSGNFVVSRHPEAIRRLQMTGNEITVCTLPSVPMSRMVAVQNGGDRAQLFQDAAAYLVDVAQALREEADPDKPCILVGHWSVSGAALPSGLPTDTLNEPVLNASELAALNFDAIVMGHIHKAQPICFEGFYTGSPMVTNFGEADYEHGVYIIDLDSSRVLAPEFVPLEDRRFLTVDVDLTGGGERISGQLSPRAENGVEHSGLPIEGRDVQTTAYGYPAAPAATVPADSLTSIDETDLIAAYIVEQAPLDGAVLRVRYRATEEQHRRVDQGALKRLALDSGAHRVYQITPEIVRENRARAAGVDETLAPLEAVEAWLTANAEPDFQAPKLIDLTRDYLERVA